MKTLVTGATGFIGSHVVDRLLEVGHDVTVLVRDSSNLRWLKDKPVTMVKGDVLDLESLREAVEDREVVFHIAGAIRARSYSSFDRTNHLGTKNLMEAVLQYDPQVEKVIYVSSLAAGGPTTPDAPLTEKEPSRPLTSYGISKYAGEQTALSYQDKIHVLAIRPPVVYGSRDHGVLNFFKMISKHIQIKIGQQSRYFSLIHVSDLAEALLLSATRQTKSGDFYYVDDGSRGHSEQEIQEAIAKTLDSWTITMPVPLSLLFIISSVLHGFQWVTGRPTWLNLTRYRQLSQQAWLCSGERIRTELGHQPKITLEQGVKDTAEWYRSTGWLR